MKNTLKAIPLALMLSACGDFKFDRSDSRSVGNDGWNRNENGQIVSAPTPSSEDTIDEVLND